MPPNLLNQFYNLPLQTDIHDRHPLPLQHSQHLTHSPLLRQNDLQKASQIAKIYRLTPILAN